MSLSYLVNTHKLFFSLLYNQDLNYINIYMSLTKEFKFNLNFINILIDNIKHYNLQYKLYVNCKYTVEYIYTIIQGISAASCNVNKLSPTLSAYLKTYSRQTKTKIIKLIQIHGKVILQLLRIIIL
jgi:hypothetical protein